MREHTLAVLVVHGLERVVDRTFRTESSAIAWRNRQNYTATVVELPGAWKAGDRVPLNVRARLAWFS